MDWKKFFSITKWKVIVFFVILIIGIVTVRGPLCLGPACQISFTDKFISYSSSVILPGTTNLFRDNGFFIGYKTYGIWDAIPQLIIHVGMDIIYWYVIICFLATFASFITTKTKK